MNRTAKQLIRTLIEKELDRMLDEKLAKYQKPIADKAKKEMAKHAKIVKLAKEFDKAKQAEKKAEENRRQAWSKLEIALPHNHNYMGIGTYTIDAEGGLREFFEKEARNELVPDSIYNEIRELRADAFLRVELAGSVKQMKEAVEFLKEGGIDIELPV